MLRCHGRDSSGRARRPHGGASRRARTAGAGTLTGRENYAPRSLEPLELRLDVRNVFDRTCASRSSDGLDFTGC
ncbi:MAG: hypothetical protein CMP09_23980 [Yangia sp.]|nr:hypothetical protein [Salipiger sp.]